MIKTMKQKIYKNLFENLKKKKNSQKIFIFKIN